MINSTGNDVAGTAPDPDDDVNDDDNGYPVGGHGVVSHPITLSDGAEPTNDGDTDPNSNLSVDFGFFNPENCTETATAVVTNGTVCSSDQGAGENVLDLMTLVASGDTGGTWADTDVTGGLVGSTFTYDAAMGAGPFSFTYTVAGQLGPGDGVCNDQVYTISITIEDCTPACAISAVDIANLGACNDNGTPDDLTDDTYTVDVLVTFANAPTTGILAISGDATASVAAGSLDSATSHTFVGVVFPANGATSSFTVAFSDAATCTITVTSNTVVEPCVPDCPAPTCIPVTIIKN